MGLWASEVSDERPARPAKKPSNGKGSDWVTSLDTFFKDLARMEEKTFDND